MGESKDGEREAALEVVQALEKIKTDWLPRVGRLVEYLGESFPTGKVLTMAALLDNELKRALESHMPGLSGKTARELYESTGPLATFSAKIKIARAFGIITKELAAELDKIRSIRNDFAHSDQSLQFETPAIADQIKKLTIVSTAKDLLGSLEEAVALALNGLERARKRSD